MPQDDKARVTTKGTHTTKNGSRPLREKLKEWIYRESSLTNTAIAVASVVLAVVGTYQWNVLKGQLSEMQKAGRPFIFAIPTLNDEATDRRIRTADGKVSFNVLFTNSSTSPAVDYRASEPQLEIGPKSLELAKKCEITYPERGAGVLSPIADPINSRFLKTVRSPDAIDWNKLQGT